MGNFEKLVVVAVLFVAAIVLAFSLNRDDSEVAASDPLRGAELVLGEEASEGALPAPIEPYTEPAPTPFLNVGTDTMREMTEPGMDLSRPAGLQPSGSPASLSLESESDPSQRILTAAVGLRPSFIDEYMVYTVAQGDSWSSLAQRFYQDGRYTRNLMRANDELAELTPGNEILVPIYDELVADGTVPAMETAPEPGMETASRTSSAGRPESAADGSAFVPASATLPESVPPRAPSKPALEYVVQPGDTLSDISLVVFGTSTRWKELLSANGDKLASAESLQAGMKLRIPEGGKLPAPGAAKSAPKTASPKTASKNEVKPATTPAQLKKKKVL